MVKCHNCRKELKSSRDMFDYKNDDGSPITFCKKCDEKYRKDKDIKYDEMECLKCGKIIPNRSELCPECGKATMVAPDEEHTRKNAWSGFKSLCKNNRKNMVIIILAFIIFLTLIEDLYILLIIVLSKLHFGFQ